METYWLGDCEIAKCVIVLDTSILLLVADGLASFDNIYDVDYGCRLVVIKPVLQEIIDISKRDLGKKSRLAKWVLENIIPMVEIEDFIFEGSVDDALIAFAKDLRDRGFKVFIASADRKVREKAMKESIEVIVYRSSEKIFETL
ncbi:MAG: hypothetical protein QW632_00660 [Ignisphaera sp.]